MRAFALSFLLVITGCAHNATTVIVDQKIEGPKVIALDAPRTPWVVEIEQSLRKSGFKVLRRASVNKVTEKVTDARTEEYRESATRYVLVVSGSAPMDSMHRCFAGGYDFEYLTAELVDTRTNETLLNVTGSGYSENCPPMSGSLFGNITSAVVNAWH